MIFVLYAYISYAMYMYMCVYLFVLCIYIERHLHVQYLLFKLSYKVTGFYVGFPQTFYFG